MNQELISRLARQTLQRCDELATCTEDSDPSLLTRTCLGEAMKKAHSLTAGWMEEAGLTVRLDGAGNLCGRRAGQEKRIVVTGSHLDTIVHAGRYDGILGVLLGIALARLMEESRVKTRLGFEVVAFADEEGVRFKQPYLGSIGYMEGLRPGLLELTDGQGISLKEALLQFGVQPDEIGRPSIAAQDMHSFFELHIEQGPVLEARGLALGIVTAIVGQRWYTARFEGQANHAGTTPMELRRDALCGAAEWILSTEELARSTPDFVATVGRIEAQPGVTNAVPGRVELTLDIRHPDDTRLRDLAKHLEERARTIAGRRQLDFFLEERSSLPAAPCSSDLMDKWEDSLQAMGLPPFRLLSGAGHDARIVALKSPISMLFIHSPRGLSHHPEESVRENDVALCLQAAWRYFQSLG
ncbi:MAG: Zn-dependent hydrolase [Spirochaetales bacterium]|nr:Zn-dependent hydrolase [Spirochaetales bacterium]